MKKYFFLLGIFFLTIISCKSNQTNSQIITTIYPFKAILQEVAGNRINIKTILPAGADPHTYEMLPSDFQSIQNSKAFFYGAASLDGWAAKIDAPNKIELLKFVPADYLIEIKDNRLHDHNIEANEESLGIDPHFWTDPNTVKAMLPNLVNELIKIDPDGENEYRKNMNDFINKLSSLDLMIKDEVGNIKNKNVFTSHPFYSYFFERYGFKVAGSLEVAPGSQPTPKDLKELIELIKTENVKAIFTNQQHSDKPAKVLAESSGVKDYELDPIGGFEDKMTYEEIIIHNLKIIKEALK